MKKSAWNCSGWKRPRIPKPFKRELDFKILFVLLLFRGRRALSPSFVWSLFPEMNLRLLGHWETCLYPSHASLWGSVSVFLGMQVKLQPMKSPCQSITTSWLSLSCVHSKPDWLKGRLWGSSIPKARHEPRFCLATPYVFKLLIIIN